MRITIVQGPFLPVPPLRGGAVEKIWFALGQEFVRRGHTVTHVSRRFPGLPDEETIEGVQHIRVGGFDAPPTWRPFRGFDLLWSLRLVWDFVYAWRAHQSLPDADIVVTNTFWLPVLLPTSGPHGALYVHLARYPKLQVRWYRHAARLQPVSSVLATRLTEIVPEAANRIRYLPNPLLGTTTVQSEREFDVATPGRQKLIVFTGRIHPQKGLGILVDAFARFLQTPAGSGWRLRLIGPSASNLGGAGEAYQRELQSRIAHLGDTVEWAGFVAEPAVLKQHLLDAGIYVYPSVDRFGEASPLAPLEAMACGCPTIVSNLDCFRDYLSPGEDGWTFEIDGDDPAGALSQVLTSIACSPVESSRVARNGWRRAQQFALESVGAKYLEDFEDVRAASPQPAPGKI